MVVSFSYEFRVLALKSFKSLLLLDKSDAKTAAQTLRTREKKKTKKKTKPE